LLGQPRVPFKVPSLDGGAAPGSAGPRSARLQLLGMPAGFLANPLGLDPDEDLPGVDAAGNLLPASGDPDFIQFNAGNFNPYFDLRRPGDPGGLGYYKVYSQVQLFDAGSTSLCLGLQAYTPAGVQFGGVNNGPTYVVPALACFHDLGRGAALQGYFGQNIRTTAGWTDRLNGNFHYGMAIQCPVPGTTPTAEQGVFLFFQALGRYRYDTGAPNTSPLVWDFIPGVHLRVNPNCWMSLGASRYNFLSCYWQY
jgi:hypothetical protein